MNIKKNIGLYFMTFLVASCLFRVAPDFEAKAWPIIGEQTMEDVRRTNVFPVISEQHISEVKRTNDSVCFTWSFTKMRDTNLSFIAFNAQDAENNIYDAETTDQDTKEVIYSNPNKARWPVGTRAVRHLCTTLPYTNDPLTVRGVLVYKTYLNLWQVTHFTPTIVVPKGD